MRVANISIISGEKTSDTVLTVKTISGGATDSAITNGAFEVRIYT